MFENNRVSAESIDDFINKYYKPSRLTAQGYPDYEQILKASHNQDFLEHGFDIISHHDSRTGEVVAYFGTDKYPDRKVITPIEYAKSRYHDYTSVIDGDLYIMDMDEMTGGTILRPVYVFGHPAPALLYEKR
jgi:hypothetical protein